MAARPSRRPHRDQSPYITLKWHRLNHSGARSQQNQGGGGPVGPRDLVLSPCGFRVPSTREQINSLGCREIMSCETKLFRITVRKKLMSTWFPVDVNIYFKGLRKLLFTHFSYTVCVKMCE